MPIPIVVREEREEDFFDPYLCPDERLWIPLDEAARDHVRLRHLWRDVHVLHTQRESTEDALTRAVLGRYLLLEVCSAKDFTQQLGKHLAEAPRDEDRVAFREAAGRFNATVEVFHEDARRARNTFVAHRGRGEHGESAIEEMRRLRRFVQLPDSAEFHAALEALHRLVNAVTELRVGSYGRSHQDPTTGRMVISRMHPLRLPR